MKTNLIIYTTLLSVICILLILLQYYHSSLQRLTETRKPDPLFLDLIPSRIPKPPRRSTQAEIQQCLKVAHIFNLSGRAEKALKIYRHAITIAPDDPDVLVKYGEFLEQHDDVLLADEMYLKALILSPDNDSAYNNRKRTAHLVDHIDIIMFSKIDEKRDLLRANFNAINFEVKKSAFYLHIYHTVAIEGNTMTMSQLQYVLETGRAIGGKSIIEHNEVLGLDLALRYVKNLANNNIITLADILMIHKRVMGYVEPLASGVYRTQQVFVGNHIPPPPEQLDRLMREFMSWLNSEEAFLMHPVKLAALAHYKFVDIHPFTDGNGRTSRLIMNLILLRSGYPPVMICKEDRMKYYECLNVANAGDIRPFVRFISYCTDETLNMYLGLNKRLGREFNVGNVIEMDGFNNSLVINYF